MYICAYFTTFSWLVSIPVLTRHFVLDLQVYIKDLTSYNVLAYMIIQDDNWFQFECILTNYSKVKLNVNIFLFKI
jgi:hypothetical protein